MSGLTLGTDFTSLADAFMPLFIETSCVACAICLIAFFAAWVHRQSSASARHLVWGAALLAILLFPALAGTVPKLRVLPRWLARTASLDVIDLAADGRKTGELSNGKSAASSRRAADLRDRVTGPTTGHDAATLRTVRPPGADSIASTQGSRRPHFVWSSSVWIAAWTIGAGFALLRLALSRLWLSRVARSAVRLEDGPMTEEVLQACRGVAIRGRVEFLLTARRVTPMTWGVFQKRVLLPAEAADWPRLRLRRVLLHELAHVKHHDTVTHVMAQIVLALYWFHPCVWLAVWRLHVERERACDDAVLQTGIRPSDYAEDLLCILAQRPIPRAALAIVGQSELEGRLHAILSDTIDRRSVTRGSLALTTTLIVLVTAAVASLRPSDAAKPTPPPSHAPHSAKDLPAIPKSATRVPAPNDVHMICVDEGGKPVSGAEVHLFQYSGGDAGRYVHCGPFTTNAAGEAICSDPIVMSDDGNYDRFLYARVPGALVGMGRSSKWKYFGPINSAGKVVLQPSQSVDGTIHVPPGFDPTRVVVRVLLLAFIDGSGETENSFPRYDGFPGLDTSLPGSFECRPDSRGRFRFADVPVKGRLYVAASGDGLGEGQWWNRGKRFDKPIEITLDKESRVSGIVETPDGRPAAGMKIKLQISPKVSFEKPLMGYQSSFRTETDAAGHFLLQGLPEVKMMLYVEDPKGHWVFRPLQNVSMPPPEMRTVFDCRMEHGMMVRGRVLDPEGKPLQGADVSAVADANFQAYLGHSRTDANGRYQFHLPAGHAELYLSGLPQGFAYPNPDTFKTLELKAGESELQIPDFTVHRATRRRT